MPPTAIEVHPVTKKPVVLDPDVLESEENVHRKPEAGNILEEESGPRKQFGFFYEKKPVSGKNVRYHYVDSNRYGPVWPNVIMFGILHAYYVYGIISLVTNRPIYTWMFGYIYTHMAGIGITSGAHRLWSHRAYKARTPLRIVLMLLHTMAGQNDLYTWIRDHRLHHKFTETDADPHNSRRGMFFAHVGWLLTKKHPDVMIKGKTIDMSDILADPVIQWQRKFYIPLYLTLRLVAPTVIPIYFWQETFGFAIVSVFTQYIGSLHATWFVNSAAHMFGDRQYNHLIQPRNNMHVNFLAQGEGYHNYHHTFPWDYAIDEHGSKLNIGKHFIDAMAKLNLAHSMKRATKMMIESRKQKVKIALAAMESNQNNNNRHLITDVLEDPYANPHEF